MINAAKLFVLIAGCAAATLPVHAKDYEVIQKDKKFSMKNMTVKVGGQLFA